MKSISSGLLLIATVALGFAVACDSNDDCINVFGSNFCCGFEYIAYQDPETGILSYNVANECMQFTTGSGVFVNGNGLPVSAYCKASNDVCATDSDCDTTGNGNLVCRLLQKQTDDSFSFAQCVSYYMAQTPSVVFWDNELYNVLPLSDTYTYSECSNTASCSSIAYPSLFYNYDYCCGALRFTSNNGESNTFQCINMD